MNGRLVYTVESYVRTYMYICIEYSERFQLLLVLRESVPELFHCSGVDKLGLLLQCVCVCVCFLSVHISIKHKLATCRYSVLGPRAA